MKSKRDETGKRVRILCETARAKAISMVRLARKCMSAIGLPFLSSVWLARSTYNPFIYFRF